MQIRLARLASVMVENQDNALRFYTTILGFVQNKDIPMGPFRWPTVSSPEGAEGVDLVLEPMAFPPAQEDQKALSQSAWVQSRRYCLRTPVATSSTWSNPRLMPQLKSIRRRCVCLHRAFNQNYPARSPVEELPKS